MTREAHAAGRYSRCDRDSSSDAEEREDGCGQKRAGLAATSAQEWRCKRARSSGNGMRDNECARAEDGSSDASWRSCQKEDARWSMHSSRTRPRRASRRRGREVRRVTASCSESPQWNMCRRSRRGRADSPSRQARASSRRWRKPAWTRWPRSNNTASHCGSLSSALANMSVMRSDLPLPECPYLASKKKKKERKEKRKRMKRGGENRGKSWKKRRTHNSKTVLALNPPSLPVANAESSAGKPVDSTHSSHGSTALRWAHASPVVPTSIPTINQPAWFCWDWGG